MTNFLIGSKLLSPYRNSIWELIHNTYFFVQREPLILSAFSKYLNDVETIENAIEFDIREQDLGTLIEEIFINLDEVNRLFQQKFKCKLFCPPVAACSFMSRATKRREINLTVLVAAIGSVLNGICQREIEKLVSATKGTTGSINKISDAADQGEKLLETPKMLALQILSRLFT